MSKQKKLNPAQREKKQQAAEARKQAQKQAKFKTFTIAAIAILAVILAGSLLAYVLSDRDTDTTATSSNSGTAATSATIQTTPPDATLQGDGATLETAVATHIAKIEIKNYGTITLELYGNTAPISVNNFVALAENGFYDGLTFHRIIEGFMMQGGAPSASSPVISSIPGEFSDNGYVNNLRHKRGVISMARSSVMNSATSQFFIMHADKTHLDGQYAAFGIVIEGIEIVDAICADAQPTDGNGSIAAAQQPVILSVTFTAIEN